MNTQETTGANTYSSTIHGSGLSTGVNTEHKSESGNYLQGRDAKEALMRGVMLVNDAVKLTIGPKGKDAVLGMFEWPYSGATNDGAFIAERVKSDDPYEQMGVRLIQESIGRANKASGDGSTTTCVLTAAILREGMKHSGDLKKELNDALTLVLESIDRQTKEVPASEVWKVAAVSAQDGEMGRMIGDIYEKIGKDGVVVWDGSNTEETTYQIKDGIELRNVTFAHPSMINAHTIKDKIDNPMQGDCIVVNNPRIMLTTEKINSIRQLEPYITSLRREGVSEMVVLADEVEPMALSEIEANAMGMNPRTRQVVDPFKVIVLRAPTLWKDWIYEDFALMTGATVFGVGQQASFKGGASLSWLGTCDKIVARRGGTDIIGTLDISEHIAILKEAAKEHVEYEKRVEWLNSKSAVVKMGARSEVELFYKRMKFDDARNAAKLALQGGVVLGGGHSFFHAAGELEGKTSGEIILKEALKAPTEQIRANGHEFTFEELEAAHVFDPAMLEKNAIKAAVSIASTVLNAETLLPYEHQQKYA